MGSGEAVGGAGGGSFSWLTDHCQSSWGPKWAYRFVVSTANGEWLGVELSGGTISLNVGSGLRIKGRDWFPLREEAIGGR